METVPLLAFGTLLRRHRLAAGLTQEELAERVYISRRSVSDMERGVPHRPRRETVDLLADALGLTAAEHTAFVQAAGRLRPPASAAGPSSAPSGWAGDAPARRAGAQALPPGQSAVPGGPGRAGGTQLANDQRPGAEVKHGPRSSTLRLLAPSAEEGAALQARASPPDDVDPAVSSGAPPAPVAGNLPLALTSFVGRAHEVATVRRLLGGTRLLTLTGAGGCGKTRLALEVARALARDGPPAAAYRDGIWLVELAALSDGARVAQAVATILGLQEQAGQSLLARLTTFLQPQNVLLLLDNCEHLVGACAELADAVLRACPQVTILATSREALGIVGEPLWRVPSLSLPDLRGGLTPEQAAACEAVQLFVQRAQALRPNFAPTGHHVILAAQVCRRLDGIPLAIELAAARLSALSLDQLAARLDDRLQLLTGGSRTVLPRQQTLRATLDWSYDLLGEPERLLLRRLTVFAGSWTLEAAEVICAGEGIASAAVLDLLTGLVNKSLVLLDEGRAGARYRLLETVRQYGREKLEAAEDEATVRDRHLDWHLALANQAALRMGGAEREMWLERLEVELENLRTALHWSSLKEGRQEAGLLLSAALEDFWYMRGYASEGRRWLEALLERAGAASAGVRARALDVLALLTYYQGDYAHALRLFEAAYALHCSEGNVPSATWALTHQALVATNMGEYHRATTLLEQVLPAHRQQGDRHGVGWDLCYLAKNQQLQGDYARAATLYGESLAVFRELGDKFGIANLLSRLANVARDLGDHEQAKRLHRETLSIHRALMDKPGFADCFGGLAMVATAEGQPLRAARLFGAAEGLRAAMGRPVEPVDRRAYDRTVADVHAALGEDAFAAWAMGLAMGLEAAIAEALEGEASR
jgi:non-specific serine/threonine protein kinase